MRAACQSLLDAQNRAGIVGKPRLVTRVSGLLSVRRIDHRRLEEALTNRWAHRKGSVRGGADNPPPLPHVLTFLYVAPAPLGGRRGVRQRVYALIAIIATSVRFFAFIFLMTLRTWTLTVLSHMFNSWAMILFDLPCWMARTTKSSRLVRVLTRERVVGAGRRAP